MCQDPFRQVTFSHITLKGSAYKIGRTQAEIVKQMPELAKFLSSGAKTLSPPVFEIASNLFEKYCPGVNEEIRGLADGLGVPVEHIIYYAETYLRAGHCSHLAVLPSISESRHVLVGRSYEFGDTMDDLRLCSMHVDGKYAYVGFSGLLFGCHEGMNEHGLSVTTSVGGMPVSTLEGFRPPIQDGLQFWALVRAVLEQCRTVDEALRLIGETPTCGNPNLIVADKGGSAALVEIFGPHKAVKRVDDSGPEKYLCSTNHFTIPEMRQHDSSAMRNSRIRYQTIQASLDQAAPRITRETIKTLLSTRYPEGLCCHYYDEFFGTLRSIVFDLTAGELEVCFGSPAIGDWHQVDLTSPSGATQYPIQLPLEKADPSFWEQTA